MMKRLLTALLAALLLWNMPAGLASTEYVSLADIKESVPDRWTQSYETKWRTVEIDVQPYVPDAKEMPVLYVIPAPEKPDITPLGANWESQPNDDGGVFVMLDDGGEEEMKRARKQGGTTTTSLFFPPYDINKVYAENSDMTLNDVLSELKSVFSLIGEDLDNWNFDRPRQVLCNSTVNQKTGEFLLPGIYGLLLDQQLSGIPLYCHVTDCLDNSRGREATTFTILQYSFDDYENAYFAWQKVKTAEVVATDVPLCDFSVVKKTLEDEINAGHIRKIFDLDLGYALHNDPNVEYGSVGAPFYAAPVWRVNCLYIESGNQEMRDYTGLDVPERAVIECKTVLVNAQTGELLNPNDSHKGCADYQGFISWDDVGGKP